MTLTRSLALTAALAVAALGAPATTTIAIVANNGANSFNPNPVTIAAGDSLVWTNGDFAVHRIVLDNGSYDSGNITPGGSSPPFTAGAAGGAYHCSIHPSMTGTIVVTATCAYAISPASASVGAAAAAGTVSVTTAAGCAWTAASNSAFVAVTSGASGAGNGTVGYGVSANTSTGARSGTVTIAGQTFTVNQAGAACATISLSPPTLADLTVGVPATVTLTASGGAAPYSFTVASGALPAGITLSAAGVLSGTPTAAGTANFTVRVTDAGGCFSDVVYVWRVLVPVPAMPPMWMALLVVATIALGSWSVTRRTLRRR